MTMEDLILDGDTMGIYWDEEEQDEDDEDEK